MSEPNVPPPPSYTPPPPPTGTPPPSATVSPNRGLMLVLAYLPPLSIIPLVVEKDDREVQWHAKHGLVLFVVWIILAVLITIITTFVPPAGCVLWLVWPLVFVFHIILIVQAVSGKRILIPGISEYADRF